MRKRRQRPSLSLWALEIDLRKRLRHLCADWSACEFDALVERAAAIRAKYEGFVTPTSVELASHAELMRAIDARMEELEQKGRERQSVARAATAVERHPLASRHS